VSTDGEALEALSASMRPYVQIYAEEGSVQPVSEIHYSQCERSDEHAPSSRRRDSWERHASRTSEKSSRAAVSREDSPPALDVRSSNVYSHSSVEGVFGTICWSDRLKGDIWPRVERMLRAAIDTSRSSPQSRLPQAA
ncbi:hypothetical protein OY671_012844, partial [Metschnikowia pulcherrima]